MSASETSDRVATGVAGLDQMLQGGFPPGHVVLVLGPPGVGKTCLSLQFLNAGLTRGEKAVYLSLEEDPETLLASAEGFGWPLAAAVKDGRLKINRLDPQDAGNSLKRIKAELPRELQGFAPRRIVVDSVSLLSALASEESERRSTLFSLARACRAAGATSLFTAEADPVHPEVSRDALSEYVADGVLVLGPTEDISRHRAGLALRVLKMRRTGHLRTRQPYAIGPGGITVDSKAVDFGTF
jgi:KaiC/GvpD/RAD55 family RecA-like ATPase